MRQSVSGFWIVEPPVACMECMGEYCLGSNKNTLQAYGFYNSQRVMFEVTDSHEQRQFVELQWTSYFVADHVAAQGIAREGAVAPRAVHCCAKTDKAPSDLVLLCLACCPLSRKRAISPRRTQGAWKLDTGGHAQIWKNGVFYGITGRASEGIESVWSKSSRRGRYLCGVGWQKVGVC